MTQTCMFVDDNTVPAVLHSIAVVALIGRHGLDPAVAELKVEPVNKRGHPLAGGLLTGEYQPGVV